MSGFTQTTISQSAEGGRVFRQTFTSNTALSVHGHPVGEHIVVVNGQIRVGTVTLNPGDHYWTPPGTLHDAVALKNTVLIVIEPPTAPA